MKRYEMAENDSTRAAELAKWRKWKKGREGKTFALTPHRNGQWCKKVKGTVHFFGVLADRKAAQDEWLRCKDDLLAGRPKPPKDDEDGFSTLDVALNGFLEAKEAAVERGELSRVQFGHYQRICETMIGEFGRYARLEELKPKDFSRLRAVLGKGCGLRATKNKIVQVRTIFRWCYDCDLIDRPVKFGPEFKIPSAEAIRREKAASGKVRHLEAEQIRTILNVGLEDVRRSLRPQWKAMILMGINCAFGSADLATIRFSVLDLKRGWHKHPRPKTGIEREARLWPETVSAIREYLDGRKIDGDLVFRNSRGNPWNVENGEYRDDGILRGFRKMLDNTGIYAEGLGFYSLRRSFRTVADAAGDPPAVDRIMGHVDPSMGAQYRQYIEPERLEKVAEHVRRWLFYEPCPKCKEPMHVWEGCSCEEGGKG